MSIWQQGDVTLYHGDCLNILPTLEAGSVDAVVTDPPYPDYHTDKYAQADIGFLAAWPCRQLVFWSAKCEFPLDYTAIHIWRKTGVGCASMYERIFERNGHRAYRVFSGNPISNEFNAKVSRDTYWGHPSQKPLSVIIDLVMLICPDGATVLDPFMGSGTTGVACVQTGRKFIGIEIDARYFEIAKRRISEAMMQPALEGVR